LIFGGNAARLLGIPLGTGATTLQTVGIEG
jgi:hypothetical protein